MPAASTRTESLDTLFAHILDARMPEIVDNFFKKNTLLMILEDNKNVRDQIGGAKILVNLEVDENSTIKSFDRGDTFNLEDVDPVQVASYDWKYVGGSITHWFTELHKNSGSQGNFINLVETKVRNLKKSIAKEMERQLHGTGSGKDFLGLQALLQKAAPASQSDTVAGFSKSTYDWWRNQYQVKTGIYTSYLITDMMDLHIECQKGGNEEPDLIIGDKVFWKLFNDEAETIHRITSDRAANLGFKSLTFQGTDVIWTDSCPASTYYMLNTNYLYLMRDPNYWFNLGPRKGARQDLDESQQMVLAGELCVSNMETQGVGTVSLT